MNSRSAISLLAAALLLGTAALAQQEAPGSMPTPTVQQDQKAQLKQQEKQAKQNEKAAKAQAKADKDEAKAAKAQRKSMDAQEKAAQSSADTKAAENPAPTTAPPQ
jgi:peptidoglycan hydrolase CwlO-like protein